MQEQDWAVKVYGFCDELKRYCKEHHRELVQQWSQSGPEPFKVLGYPKEDPIYGYTPILQWYGTNVARKTDPDIWITALSKRLLVEVPSVAIITDVRFPNEASFVKEKGGYMVNVRRLNADGSQFLDTGRDPNHESETALDDYGYDFVIEVLDGDLKALRRLAIGALNSAKAYAAYASSTTDSDGTGFK